MTDTGPDILVLGASGYIGRSLMARLAPGRGLGTYNIAPFPGGIRFDATSMDIDRLLDEHAGIKSAVVLLGVTNIDKCANDLALSHAVNVVGVCRTLRGLHERGIFIVLASTDSVFDGAAGDYDEESPTNPILAYGKQKLEVEGFLRGLAPESCILRISKVYGSQVNDGTIVTSWLRQLGEDATIRAAADQVFSPVYIDDLLDVVIHLAESEIGGLFHVGGPQPVSRAELLDLLCEHLAGRFEVRARIEHCDINDFGFAETRPLNCSLNSEKVSRLMGRPFRTPLEVIRSIPPSAAC